MQKGDFALRIIEFDIKSNTLQVRSYKDSKLKCFFKTKHNYVKESYHKSYCSRVIAYRPG